MKDYSTREGVTELGPQVYALDSTGDVFLADATFNASSFTSLAHEYNFKVFPLIMAGAGLCHGGEVWCSDSPIIAIIENPNQVVKFGQELVSLCQTYGFDGFQLDWETAMNSTYQSAMTTALNSIANALHAMSPPRLLSLTTYYWDYKAGPYDTWTLSQGSIDQLNVQAYTSSLSTFESEVSAMETGMVSNSKLQVGLGDYSGVNPPIAGQCIQYLIQQSISSTAIWPAWGTEISPTGAYGYSDTIYGTTNWYPLLQIYLEA